MEETRALHFEHFRTNSGFDALTNCWSFVPVQVPEGYHVYSKNILNFEKTFLVVATEGVKSCKSEV